MQRSFETGSPEDLRQAASSQESGADGPSDRELSEEELRVVERLKREDERIRQHEQAHLAAAGSFARGGAQLKFETGPDGRSYAVSGEVAVDVTPVSGDPETTIRKMNTVRRAALAPMDPSPADRAVASKAAGYANRAREEWARQRVDQAHMGYRSPAVASGDRNQGKGEGVARAQGTSQGSSTPMVLMSQAAGTGEMDDTGMKEASGTGGAMLEARTVLKQEPGRQVVGPTRRFKAFA